MNLVRQLKEVIISVLPIVVLASLSSLLLGVMDASELCRFLFSSVLVIIGLTLFLSGVDVGLLPIGNRIGSALTRTRSLAIMLSVAVVLGIIITIPEPDVQVLAEQVRRANPAVDQTVLVWAIAIGVGIFLSVSLARTVLHWPMKIVLLISYAVIFSIAAFNEDFFVSVAFDSGGATTGPLSVPFIMAVGMGVAALRKHDAESEFGYVALSSIGPVCAVLILGLVFKGDAAAGTAESAEAALTLGALMLTKFREVGISLMPLIAVCVVMQIFVLKMPRTETIRMAFGIAYAYLGIVIFFTGVEYSFSDVASQLGSALSAISPMLLYAVGFLMGLAVVLAEPAVMVLTEQVEEVSSGRISKKAMLFTLALGVGCAVVLALIRTVHSLSIWTFLLPGYALIMLMMIKTPGLFSAIGFDSGGVATGPMSSTFLLPFAIGASSSGASLSASFGMIAMIAMMPILLIEVLGVVYQRTLDKKGGR